MTNLTPKLNIFYRHVHIRADRLSRDPNKSRPTWFSHETCFLNLIKTIKLDPLGERVKITIVYDGSVEDLKDDFILKYCFNDPQIHLQLIKGGSDLNSFLITTQLAQESTEFDTDLIYFLENDYLHKFGWISNVFELYQSSCEFDYLSLYDHNDKYIYDIYKDLVSKIIVTNTHHWRTAPSTCATFLLSKTKLNRDYDVLTSGLTDYYFFNKLVSERKRILLTPVPGLATHSMEGYLSPAVNWEDIARETNSIS